MDNQQHMTITERYGSGKQIKRLLDQSEAARGLLAALEYARTQLAAYNTTSVGTHHEALRKASAAIAQARAAGIEPKE